MIPYGSIPLNQPCSGAEEIFMGWLGTVDAYRVKCLKSQKKKLIIIIAVANLQIIWSETLVACSSSHYQYLASGAQHCTLQRCPVV